MYFRLALNLCSSRLPSLKFDFIPKSLPGLASFWFFRDEVSYILGEPQTYYVVEDVLQLLSLLPPSAKMLELQVCTMMHAS